jgi:tetratricopeptide (TPR) repeat protein
MSPEVFQALSANAADLGERAPARWAESLDDANALDAQLDDAELGDDIDRQVASEMARASAEDLPFDRDEAAAFDAGVPRVEDVASQTDAVYVNGFDDADPRASAAGRTIDTRSYEEALDDVPHGGTTYDGYGATGQTASSFADPTASHVVATGFPSDEPAASSGLRAETNIEDDLDEAEFYAGQGMYAEAIEVLSALLHQVPGHRMVLAKLHEIQLIEAGETGAIGAAAVTSVTSVTGALEAIDRGQDASDLRTALAATDALDLDDIEEMGAEDLVELDADSQPVHVPRKRQPTVMLEKPLDDGDSDTHYDLGLAYKEMTLLDEAIKAFEKALRAPGREVQCRVMIGMCMRDMGNPSEAIQQFKQGLHAQPSERERQSLYYEIGVTYEALGDDAEALYYFEMVLKRDPGFADASLRAERLRLRGGRAVQPHDDDL